MAESAKVLSDAPGSMLSVPKYVVSGFNGSITPVEAVVLASSLMPRFDSAGEMMMGQRPELVLAMSPQSVKELQAVLGQLVDEYEAMFGEIKTPFLEELKKS